MPRSVWVATALILMAAISVTILFWNELSVREGPTAIARNIGLVAGGLIAGVIAIWRGALASERIAVAKQEQYHTRFQKASEALFVKGLKSSHIRRAAIFAFDHLTRDRPELAEDIHEVLVAFIGLVNAEEHDVGEFHAAQVAAHRACDALEEYGLRDEEDIDNMNSVIRATALAAATRLGVKTVR